MNARIDATAFKRVMRRVPTGVTIVTSLREGSPRGVTVSAFASVSLEPPTVLICINRAARSYLYISASKIFCVNVLAAGQRELAERFAAKLGENQFEGVAYSIDASGAPVLEGCLAHLDCAVSEEHHVGSHSIFIGRVLSGKARAGEPLGYLGGAFYDVAIEVSDKA